MLVKVSDKQLVAQTWVTGDQNTASRDGFKILADYIFGNNRAPNGDSSKISMTAPVSMQQDDGKWRVQFTMPSQYTIQTLPKPNNPNNTHKKDSKRCLFYAQFLRYLI